MSPWATAVANGEHPSDEWKGCQSGSGGERSDADRGSGESGPGQASVPPVQESAGGPSKTFGGTTLGGRENSGMGKSSPLAFTAAFLSSVKPISSSVR